MQERIDELSRLVRKGLLAPALQKIDGEFYIYQIPEEAFQADLAEEIKINPKINEFINEPCDESLLDDLLVYSIVRSGLGLNQEIIEDHVFKTGDDGVETDTLVSRKIKNMAPDYKAAALALELLFPKKYGKDGSSGTSVAEWIAAVNEVQRLKKAEN